MSENTEQRKSRRGFASMDRALQREIAQKGGRVAHAKGTAHEWDTHEAVAAGKKGGRKTSKNREHMAAIGRRGGEARARRLRELADKPNRRDIEREEKYEADKYDVTDEHDIARLESEGGPAL